VGKQRSRSARYKLGLVSVVALLVIPASVWAWYENQIQFRLTQTGTGCIAQQSSMRHGNSGSEMLADGFVSLMGVNRSAAGGTTCQARNGEKYLRGRYMMGLLKATRFGSGSRRDDYIYCQVFAQSQDWSTQPLRVSQRWDKPPCGPGHYALIGCVDVETFLVDEGFTAYGTYTTSDLRIHCNATPSWHPALDGDNSSPPVKL
jgi:hypothetical protein